MTDMTQVIVFRGFLLYIGLSSWRYVTIVTTTASRLEMSVSNQWHRDHGALGFFCST